MSDSLLVLALLGLIGVCSLVMTSALVMVTRDLHRMCRQLTTILPHGERAIQEAYRTFSEARHLLSRANHATRHVEDVVDRTRDVVSDVVAQAAFWKSKAKRWWRHAVGFGNGARVEPRRSHRKVRGRLQ